jgi:hypothetical protein
MANKPGANRDREELRLGSLMPLYKFFMNPYADLRFTRSCPSCYGKTKQRKLPLAIHVSDWGMVILNKTCRFCPACELVIGHQDEIEGFLVQLFAESAPEVVGNDYLIVGTVDRKDWRRGLVESLSSVEMLAALHDFKDHLHFKPSPRWEYSGQSKP